MAMGKDFDARPSQNAGAGVTGGTAIAHLSVALMGLVGTYLGWNAMVLLLVTFTIALYSWLLPKMFGPKR